MEKPTRATVLEAAAKKLRQDFEELRTVPHAALRGGEAEDLVRRFLRDHIPRRFDVGSGFILDRNDVVSRQTDVILYDALNCPTYRTSDTAAIFPATNVAAIVEVKSVLDGRELRDAFDKIATIKALAKRKNPLPWPELDQTHCSVFAFESALSLETISLHHGAWIRQHGFGHHADVICVLDKGIVATMAKVAKAQGWDILFLQQLGGREVEGARLGIGIHETGVDALDAHFRLVLAHLMMFRGLVDHPGFRWRLPTWEPRIRVDWEPYRMQPPPTPASGRSAQLRQRCLALWTPRQGSFSPSCRSSREGKVIHASSSNSLRCQATRALHKRTALPLYTPSSRSDRPQCMQWPVSKFMESPQWNASLQRGQVLTFTRTQKTLSVAAQIADIMIKAARGSIANTASSGNPIRRHSHIS